MTSRYPWLLVLGLALGAVSLADAADRSTAIPDTPAASPADNEELARLYTEDQADRRPPAGQPLDWAVVGPRDRAREARVKELYAADQLKTGADFYHAAMVLQHGSEPDDFLLAHELCVVAISKGYQRALWLAAATEDRFLRRLGRPQRFATQYQTPQDGATILQETDERVTDAHRQAMNAPTLAEARARTARFDGPKFVYAPVAGAPTLTQDLFADTDDASAALAKVQKFPGRSADDIFRLVRACRDLCLRFNAPPIRASAMALAVSYWPRLSAEQRAQLGDWDPARGETEPEFTPEQRAIIAMRLASNRASRRSRDDRLPYEQTLFEETATAAAHHHDTRAAREALITAALHVDPQAAVLRVRDILPESAERTAAIRLLESIGQPFDLQWSTLTGRTLGADEFKGKVVLVHFFAQRFGGSTTCVPKLKELLQQHGADRFALVGVNTDTERAAAEAIVDETGITWPVYHERSGPAPTLTERLHARILPYYLLIDREGRLRFRGIQPTDSTVAARIAQLLAE